MIETIKDGTDHVISISNFQELLKNVGFINIEVKSIGEYVWEGLDKWIAQGELEDKWNRNGLKAYRDGLIDYFLITAESPSDSNRTEENIQDNTLFIGI